MNDETLSFHGSLKQGLLCPVIKHLCKLSTAASKETICHVLISIWPESKKGESVLRKPLTIPLYGLAAV